MADTVTVTVAEQFAEAVAQVTAVPRCPVTHCIETAPCILALLAGSLPY